MPVFITSGKKEQLNIDYITRFAPHKTMSKKGVWFTTKNLFLVTIIAVNVSLFHM